VLERLRKQSDDIGISVSELCRRKLREIPQLARIEFAINDIHKKLECSTKFKQEVKMAKNQSKYKKSSVEEEIEEESEDKED